MAGPEIIGYETDPNATVGQIMSAQYWSLHIDQLEGDRIVMNEWPYTVHSITDDNRTALMRYLGWRPVYRERKFRAELRNGGGYDLLCKRCNTWETFTGRGPLGPHDMAAFHEKWFHRDSQTASQIMIDMARKAQFDLDTDQWHEAL